MSYSKEELAKMSGSKEQGGAPIGGVYYNTITLGKDGKFYISFYSQPKDTRKDPDMLGSEVTLPIIKIRRKINKWQDKVNVLESTEYDAGTELIHTTAGDITEKEAKGMGGKVSLVVYAIKDDELVKFTVSGGSLYNPNDEDDMRLYGYLQSFGDDEHIFMFDTIIGAKENTYIDKDGIEAVNYQMTFKRGKTLKSLELIGTKLAELIKQIEENDARDLRFLGSHGKSTTTMKDDFDKAFEYPTEDIDTNNIPF